MKSFKKILSEIAQPKAGDEINFKAKHEIELQDYPTDEESIENIFKGGMNGKDMSRPADYDAGEDEEVYEAKMNKYICVHAKKGKFECEAETSYGAAKKAAAHWKMKSTAGIDAYLVEDVSLDESKMSNAEVLSAAKKLAANGKDAKAKSFGRGLVDFYKKNDSFTPDQVAGLQNIMKNAGFQLAKEETQLDEAKSKNKIHIGHPDDYTDDPWKHEVYINGRKVISGGYGPFKIGNKSFRSVDAFIRALAKKYNVPEDSFDLYSLDDETGKKATLNSSGFKPRKGVTETAIVEGWRVVAKSKDGETFKSGVYDSKKEAQDMLWKMSRGNKFKKVDIVKESLDEAVKEYTVTVKLRGKKKTYKVMSTDPLKAGKSVAHSILADKAGGATPGMKAKDAVDKHIKTADDLKKYGITVNESVALGEATKMDLMKQLDKDFPDFKPGKIASVNKVARFLEKQGFSNKGAMNAALDFENYKKGTFKESVELGEGNKWEYEDARGVKKVGSLIKTSEGQGTDVTYFFKGENGKTDVVSGSRLKKIKKLKEDDQGTKQKYVKKSSKTKTDDGDGLDPVGKGDADIDNDGDTDSTDWMKNFLLER